MSSLDQSPTAQLPMTPPSPRKRRRGPSTLHARLHDPKMRKILTADPDYRELGILLVEAFVARHTLYGHHRDSFEHLLVTLLGRMLSECPIIAHHKGRGIYMRADILGYYIRRPYRQNNEGRLMPMTALDTHAQRISLSGEVRARVRSRKYHSDVVTAPNRLVLREDTVFEGVELFRLPMMDGTRAMHDHDKADPVRFRRNQGTFIMNGHRKLVRVQNTVRINFAFSTVAKDGSTECEIRSRNPHKIRSSSTIVVRMSREVGGRVPKVTVDMPYVEKSLPLSVFFRLLGVGTAHEMLALVCGPHAAYSFFTFVRSVLYNCRGVKDPLCLALEASEEDLLVWVAEHRGGAKATGGEPACRERSRTVEAKHCAHYGR